jgi:protein-S-isoprenylcysteine O-methyltransferase Ste14
VTTVVSSIVPQVFKDAGNQPSNRLHRQECRFTNLAMSDTADTANVIIRPPIAWALAVLAALALQWLMPLPFMPAAAHGGWVGGAVFAIALALAVSAIATLTRAGSNVPTSMPTTTIVNAGPYRNPIYLGMIVRLPSCGNRSRRVKSPRVHIRGATT